MNDQKVLVLVGPTASGKSALAVKLAKKFNGEIISADSRQVYRGLDIGTGKITKREMQGVPHHLLDVASAKKRFTADDFVKHARKAIADIQKSGKLPIIVGGTGFYIDALVGRIELGSAKPNVNLRKKLALKTAPQLYAMLKKKDAPRATMMDTPSERNNKLRLIRALEIASIAPVQGPPLYDDTRAALVLTTPLQRGSTSPARLNLATNDLLWIGVAPPLHDLDLKIKKRLTERLKLGMIAEAKRLHADGLSYKRMEELGLEYRYLSLFLQKKISREQLESQLYSAIKRYARKQIGYWKRNKDIKWFEPGEMKHIEKMLRN